jgi:hypothetical protein
MKKNIFIMFVFVIVNAVHAFGQTKSETQEWIEYILESNSVYNEELLNIQFSKDGRTMTYYHIDIGGPGDGRNILYTDIPIKEIKKIRFKLSDDRKTVTMSIEFSKVGNSFHSGSVTGNYPSGLFKKIDNGLEAIMNLRSTNIWGLNPKIIYNGLDDRILKAFSHLVKLNGGKLVGDIF